VRCSHRDVAGSLRGKHSRQINWQNLQNKVVGCSDGSIYGVYIAKGAISEEINQLSLNMWTSELMQGYTANLRATKDGSLRFVERSGLVNDSVLNNTLEKLFGDLLFSDLQIPLKIVATDIFDGEKVILSTGYLRDAVRASIAIPINSPPGK